jgi:hypothetical protein
VSGSLVGVNLFFAADHQLVPLSFCEGDGDGGLGKVCERPGNGNELELEAGEFREPAIIANTLSSTARRS